MSQLFVDRTLRIAQAPDSGQTGFPFYCPYVSMVAISDDRVLATTWDGRCILIDVASGEIEPQPMIAVRGAHAGRCLQSPSIARGDPSLIAVATRAPWAGIWLLGDAEARKFQPQHPAAVNAVALSPHERVVALGTGYYPLSEEHRKASVELWTVDSEPRLLASTLLPDVVVDQLAWDPHSNRLLALSGVITRNGGHWWVFDADRFALLDAAATDSYMFIAAGFVSAGESIVCVTNDRVELHQLGQSHDVPRQWTFGEEITSAAVSTETDEVFLSTGDVIDLESDTVTHLKTVPDCCGVAILPGGGYVALSTSGLLRIWNELA